MTRVREGSVRLRGQRWYIRFYDLQGTRRDEAAHVVLGCAPGQVQSAADARKALKIRIEQKYKGNLLARDLERLTMSDALDLYEKDYLARATGPHRRAIRYRRSIAAARAWFGHLPAAVPHLSWLAFKEILDSKRAEGLSAGTVWNRLAVAKAALRYCAIQGMLPTLPVFPAVTKGKTRTRRPSKDEADAVFRALPAGAFHDIASIIRATGWRASEVIELHWSQLDLDRGLIRLSEIDRKTGETLTRPLAEGAMLDILTAWKSRRVVGIDRVFHHEGHAYTYSGLRDAWKRACTRAGVEDLNLHDFRRAAYDEASAAGLDVHEAMELIGHRDIATAARYMTGGNVERQRRSLARLEQYRAAVNGTPAPGRNGGKMGANRTRSGKIVRQIRQIER